MPPTPSEGSFVGKCPKCGGQIIQLPGFAPGCENNCGDLREAKSSNPKRYTHWCVASHGHQMAPDEKGAWVLYEDYDALLAAFNLKCEESSAHADEALRLHVETPALPRLEYSEHCQCCIRNKITMNVFGPAEKASDG